MIKAIPNSDLVQLIELNIDMYKSIEPEANEFGATNTLFFEANTKENFITIGLYDGAKLIGFVKGHKFSKKLFLFTGIYVKIKNNKNTKKLIDYCFKLVKDMGYSAWAVDATNSNISSIMEKYGAKVQHTRYVKEIV